MKKVRYVWDAMYLDWQLGDGHPTDPRRAWKAINLLAQERLVGRDAMMQLKPWPGHYVEVQDALKLTHSRAYIDLVREAHRSGEWTGENAKLAKVAQLMFGGTVAMVADVLREEEAGRADGVVWFAPMGAKHHAHWEYSSGFCVFNDFAWAARELKERTGRGVAYLDWDAHHGDGVQELLIDREDLVTASIHDRTIFPGTGHGSSPSAWNWPLQEGAGDPELLASVESALAGFDHTVDDLGYLLLAAGADGHANDPLSSLTYTHAGFARAAVMVGDWARERGVRVLVGGAGGYRPEDDTPIAWALVVSQLARSLG